MSPGRARQSEIYTAGALGRRPRVPTSFTELEAAAHRRMSASAWAYVAGSAGLESTAAANSAAFGRLRLLPRVLAGRNDRDLTTELLGRRLAAPILLAPIGALGLVHRKGDLAAATAASRVGIPMIFSQQASVPMERCAAAMAGSPRWFQLYWGTSDEVMASMVGRAEACGCEAVVLTVDTVLHGWRPRDQNLGHLPFARGIGIAQYSSDPAFRSVMDSRALATPTVRLRDLPRALRLLTTMARNYPESLASGIRSGLPRRAVSTFLDTFSRPDLSWSDLERLRSRTRLPILIKGLLHPDDARRAHELGIDGVIVSNHGGRQMDGEIGALDALAPIVEAVEALGGGMPVLFDSGIRGGADIVKALALGAQAVLIGRPWVYGLAVGGSAGVEQVLRDLIAELDITIGLLGRRGVGDLDPTVFAPGNVTD